MRQELKRHILKRKRRTMPKLQRMRPSAHLSNRRNLPAVKAGAVCAADRSGQFLPRKVGQKALKHRQRALLIAHFAQRGNLCKRKRREFSRHIQPAVRRQSAKDCRRGRNSSPRRALKAFA